MAAADGAAWSLFDEPAGFRPPTPPPTDATHVTRRGGRVCVRLVGTHPLWGHYLWNAAPTLSNYLEDHASAYVLGKRILELGAAAGLPSIVAATGGAHTVLATDYPDPDLVGNIQHNLDANECSAARGGVAHAQGYIWGADTGAVCAFSPAYDVILMSDLVFNHQAHGALLDTCDACLASDGTALVFFSHHRPHLADRDLAFFHLAEVRGYCATEIGAWRLKPMFPEDPGDAVVRATVHGWALKQGGGDRRGK
ncbi:nicotinamide N-methyltransferase [Malassezia sp. CBS 17886]|nr:nicotinamide N-methyltransferase [Malassezia sp. CBS 17886]